MSKKPIQCIVAVAKNGIIGRNGELPWSSIGGIPEDFEWFKSNTKGGVIIWGSQCHLEFGSLPDRGTVVLTRDRSKAFTGAPETAHNLEDAITKAHSMLSYPGPIWICGGEGIYAEAISFCDKIYITHVHQNFDGDKKFPSDWQRHFSKLAYSRDSSHGEIKFTFEIWEK
jgi:dihydrofolate reductase